MIKIIRAKQRLQALNSTTSTTSTTTKTFTDIERIRIQLSNEEQTIANTLTNDDEDNNEDEDDNQRIEKHVLRGTSGKIFDLFL